MPNMKVLDMTGKEVGTVELADSVFAVTVNAAVLHAAVRAYLLNQRQGTQSTLTRTEVSGGGKKPWRQKGTGRARPLYSSAASDVYKRQTHGGVALGPKPRSYRTDLNKKVKRIAMKSAFSSKVADDSLVVVDAITTTEFKTRTMVNMLSAVGASGKALVVLPAKDEKVVKSFANIPGVKTAYINTLNVYDILNCDKLVVALDAVKKIEEVYA